MRKKVDGTIYEWHEVLAENAKCEEVEDAMLFPQAYVKIASQAPDNLPDDALPPKKRGGRPRKDLGVDEMVASQTPPPFTSDEFSTEVGKAWPK